MVLEEAISKRKSILCNKDVNFYDNKVKNVTSSGRELHTILMDMGVYVAVATPHITSCVWRVSPGVTPTDVTYHIATGTTGPSVGIVITMALSTTDTPRFIDFDVSVQNSTRGSGYTSVMSDLKADLFQQKPELVVLYTRVNGKNANAFACADVVDLIIHPDSGLSDGDILKIETIDVGHPYYEQYMAKYL